MMNCRTPDWPNGCPADCPGVHEPSATCCQNCEPENPDGEHCGCCDQFDPDLAELRRPDIEADHERALLENLLCELCGRIEQHPNHRGTGHTHTPAEDPQGRAHALLALVNTAGLVVPQYVFSTALMMASSADPDAIVGIDYLEAVIECRRVLAGRRLERRCEICGPGADHTNRAHDDAFDASDRRPDLARIADDPDTPIYVAETAAIMSDGPEEAILFDHESALVIDREYRAAVVGPEVGARELDHPAEPLFPHSGVCRTCRRPIHVRTDDRGVFVSAAHYA
jgi:hypothetical protein